MQTSTLVLVLLILTALAYQAGRQRSLALVGGLRGARNLHSLPSYYGLLTALWCAIPALLVLAIWHSFDGRIVTNLVVASMPAQVQQLDANELSLVLNDVRDLVSGAIPAEMASAEVQAAARRYVELESLSRLAAAGLCLAIALGLGAFSWSRISPELRARNAVERVVRGALVICSLIAIFTTIGIVVSVLFESIRFFQLVPVTEFLFGTQWSPQMAIRADQVGSSGAFGAVPLFAGTALIAGVAMIVSVPVGLFAAIYLAEYAPARCARPSSPSWRCWPESRRWSTASLRPWSSDRCCARPASPSA